MQQSKRNEKEKLKNDRHTMAIEEVQLNDISYMQYKLKILSQILLSWKI